MSRPDVRPLPISVNLIAGAEERRIGQTLASVHGWTSEIIVVLNDDVTDRTEEIARSFGAQVFREPWRGFIGQKNSVAEKTTQPWLLGLDCDEVVSSELRDEIHALFENGPRDGSPAAYSFPRKTWFGDRWILHGEWYPDRQIRLWKRGKARWAGIEPHAKLEVDGRIGRLGGELEHYSFESVGHHVRKSLGYAEDFSRDCTAAGRRVSCLDLIVRPPWRFIRSYFLRLGFLDGWPGFDIAWLSAFYTFLRYQRAHQERRRVVLPRDLPPNPASPAK